VNRRVWDSGLALRPAQSTLLVLVLVLGLVLVLEILPVIGHRD
jgi:hypothetical protein